MTPEEFFNEMWMIRARCGNDEELVHGEMDDLMCHLLRELGYEKGVEIFEDTPKWYA